MDLINWNCSPIRYERDARRRIYWMWCLESEKGVKSSQTVGLGNWTKGLNTHSYKEHRRESSSWDGHKSRDAVFNLDVLSLQCWWGMQMKIFRKQLEIWD